MILRRNRKSTTYLHLMGGLGNQLFQIAAGLSFSLKSGNALVIDESFGIFRKNIVGEADVHGYGVNKYYSFFRTSKQNRLLSRSIGLLIRISLSTSKGNLNKIAKCLLSTINSLYLSKYLGTRVKIWSANVLGYEEISRDSISKYLLGYFQTYKFASEDQVKLILNRLSISDPLVTSHREIYLATKTLIVHIRLGDYRGLPNFGLLSKNYYDEAITLMMTKFEFKNICVYSDSIDDAKEYIPHRYLKLCHWMDSKNESAAVTLEKMRCGAGYIIANSSFSWWGAFLSHTINAPIIAPKPWFAGMDEPNELIPPSWIRINRN
jgi:hypothetical protein